MAIAAIMTGLAHLHDVATHFREKCKVVHSLLSNNLNGALCTLLHKLNS